MCGGCKNHSFPYSAKVPISINGKFPVKTFNNDRDVWDIIDLIIEETMEVNKNGDKSFDIPSAVSQQLPHFSCPNIMINNESQRDISQYLYCKEFKISPFPGSYLEQPNRWIKKVNIIKNAFAKKEDRMYRKAQREAEMKGGK